MYFGDAGILAIPVLRWILVLTIDALSPHCCAACKFFDDEYRCCPNISIAKVPGSQNTGAAVDCPHLAELRSILLVPARGSGGIGRRASLRSLLEQSSGGSSPPFRTTLHFNDLLGLASSGPASILDSNASLCEQCAKEECKAPAGRVRNCSPLSR